jgi:hypothetical protein
LKDGINDGYLTPFKVKQISTTLDEYIYTPDDQLIEGEIESGRRYTETDPLFLLPGWVAVLFSCVGEVGGTRGDSAARCCGRSQERCAEATLAHPALEQKAEAQQRRGSQHIGYRNQSTVRRRRPILATGRFMRPLTRQNHHSGYSMLIGCDAHNQNTFRDPEKQKPPRPESG